MGYSDIILKGDGEPALVQVMEDIKDEEQVQQGQIYFSVESI